MPSKHHLLLTGLLLGCTAESDKDTAAVEPQACAATVDLEFPDGSWASFDGCNDVLVDATYEFDPDDPPEIRSFKLQLTGAVDPGFDCWIIVTATGLCGPGYYDIGSGQSTSVLYEIHDCPYVPDGFEDGYTASGGVLLLDDISAGDEPGNYEGEPLLTHIAGAIESTSSSGVRANLGFDLSVRIRGEDAEETICDKAD